MDDNENTRRRTMELLRYWIESNVDEENSYNNKINTGLDILSMLCQLYGIK